jgi:hypothetical protein
MTGEKPDVPTRISMRRARATRSVAWLAAVAILPLTVLPAALAGQGAPPESPEGPIRLTGTVFDRSEEEPITGAAIRLVRIDAEDAPIWEGVSDEEGRFRAADIPVGEYRIEFQVPRYSPLSSDVVISENSTVDVEARMVPVDVVELEPVVATAVRRNRLEAEGFYDRRRMASGQFVTREEIETRSPNRVTDLFQMIPGVQVIPEAMGPTLRLRNGCVPRVVLDGAILSEPVFIDDIIGSQDLEAVEVHNASSIPSQYVGQTACGVVMLWTRDAAELTAGNPPSWRRFAVWIGLAAALLVLGG